MQAAEAAHPGRLRASLFLQREPPPDPPLEPPELPEPPDMPEEPEEPDDPDEPDCEPPLIPEEELPLEPEV